MQDEFDTIGESVEDAMHEVEEVTHSDEFQDSMHDLDDTIDDFVEETEENAKAIEGDLEGHED